MATRSLVTRFSTPFNSNNSVSGSDAFVTSEFSDDPDIRLQRTIQSKDNFDTSSSMKHVPLLLAEQEPPLQIWPTKTSRRTPCHSGIRKLVLIIFSKVFSSYLHLKPTTGRITQYLSGLFTPAMVGKRSKKLTARAFHHYSKLHLHLQPLSSAAAVRETHS